MNRELEFFHGNLVGCMAQPTGSRPVNVISVYSPAWPVDRERLRGIHVTGVKLEQNPEVWVTEIIWSALVKANPGRDERWIVGGDFNASETFDYLWREGPRGNREFLDRMGNLGFIEGLREHCRELAPTFRDPRSGQVVHQMDHLFVTPVLAASLRNCRTGNQMAIFGEGLSDHLPIIADFEDGD